MKTAFSSFIFDLFWLLSEKMHDSGRKRFNKFFKKMLISLKIIANSMGCWGEKCVH